MREGTGTKRGGKVRLITDGITDRDRNKWSGLTFMKILLERCVFAKRERERETERKVTERTGGGGGQQNR